MSQEMTIYQQGQTTPVAQIAAPDREQVLIDQWLTAKCARSASTRAAYELVMRKFQDYLAARSLHLFALPEQVALAAASYARTSYDRRGRVRNGQLSEGTINQRLAILSSFYEYCHKFNKNIDNPLAVCDREKKNVHDAAQHFDAIDLARVLAEIPRDSLKGLRDYALLLLACTTGRRAAEVAELRRGDLAQHGRNMQVTWRACKGGKTMTDVLGQATRAALEVYLLALYGPGAAGDDAPVFVSLSHNNYGQAMSTQALADISKHYLGTSKFHTTRHTFSMNMEAAGASWGEIGERLGHSSIATTNDYMKRRHSAENKHIGDLEKLYGVGV